MMQLTRDNFQNLQTAHVSQNVFFFLFVCLFGFPTQQKRSIIDFIKKSTPEVNVSEYWKE